jgi:hypothetical protein
MTRPTKTPEGMTALLCLGAVLIATILCCLGGCGSTSSPPPVIVPPPPALTYIGIDFSWPKPALTLPACNHETDAAGFPCQQYALIDQATGKVIANPPLTATTYRLTPAPAAWPHSYAMVVQNFDQNGTMTQSAVPDLVTVTVK